MEIEGQWYVFYHRQTGKNEYSRQAMMEPVDVALGKDGRLYIGDVKYLAGEPVSSKPVEMTSQGPHINGLDAYKWISAGYACHLSGGSKTAYIEPVYEERDDVSMPVSDITSGTTVGFKYLQFGCVSAKTVTVVLAKPAKVTVKAHLDYHKGRVISTIGFNGAKPEETGKIAEGVIGKHAVYFEFLTEDKEAALSFDRFTFDR